jgi:hypothetical protein
MASSASHLFGLISFRTVYLCVQVPNDVLIDSKLVNVSRGGAYKDTVTLDAPIALPPGSISAIKAALVSAGDARGPKEIVPGSPHVKVCYSVL